AAKSLFVFGPLLVWIVVTLWAKVPNPFLTLLTVGVFYGILLAAGHQIFWTAQFGGAPPRLGGNLADLDPGLSNLIVRLFAAGSSLITGTSVGAVTGAIAWLVDRLLGRKRGQSGSACSCPGARLSYAGQPPALASRAGVRICRFAPRRENTRADRRTCAAGSAWG